MNIELIDKWLENEYGVSYTRLEELHDFVVEQDLKHREQAEKEIERLNNIINEFEEWLKRNFWNDDEGNESYQIEKYTTYYSVYKKLDLLKTINKGDKSE